MKAKSHIKYNRYNDHKNNITFFQEIFIFKFISIFNLLIP